MPLRRRKFTGKKRVTSTRKRAYGRVSSKVGYSMRRKYARKTAYRRRRTFKKKSAFSSYLVDPRSRLYPMVKRATLVYVNEGIVLVPPAAKGCAVTIWNCIGLFDPEYAFGGHQPMYFDSLMAQYNNYAVRASKIEVVFSFPANNDQFALHCGVAVRPNPNVSIQPHIYAENGGSKSFLHCQNQGTRTLSISYYPGKTFGTTGRVIDNDAYVGDKLNNPSAEPTFHVYVGNASAITAASGVTVSLKIQYDSYFFNPVNQDPNLLVPPPMDDATKAALEAVRANNPLPDEDTEEMVTVPASMMSRLGL